MCKRVLYMMCICMMMVCHTSAMKKKKCPYRITKISPSHPHYKRIYLLIFFDKITSVLNMGEDVSFLMDDKRGIVDAAVLCCQQGDDKTCAERYEIFYAHCMKRIKSVSLHVNNLCFLTRVIAFLKVCKEKVIKKTCMGTHLIVTGQIGELEKTYQIKKKILEHNKSFTFNPRKSLDQEEFLKMDKRYKQEDR